MSHGTLPSELLHAPIINNSLEIQDKTAFITRDNTLLYRQLRDTVLQGCKWLQDSGCRPGDTVAICLPKSTNAIEAIFSTLAAGAIFLPIDPNTPVARLVYLVSDAQACHLITYSRKAYELEQHDKSITAKITVLDEIDAFQKMVSNITTDGNLPDKKTDDTALLYYTSGTTGKPKAIMLSHANVSSFTQWVISTFNINRRDCVASHAPFHFDLSTLDLFAATRVGASVVILDEASVKFPSKISQLIEQHKISVWYSVPTALIQLYRHGALERRKLDALRLILFAGEVFPVPDLVKLVEKLPHCEYANLYGPTETNVCTYYRFNEPPAPDARDIPVGIACEHLTVKLYREDDTEVAVGETGELVVFGPAVMQGYLNQPELTSKSRFKDDKQSYRTGDFAYLDNDNQLHLVGRKDDQVKFRGHRIELLEISSVISLHPDIMETAVLLSEPPGGEAAIIAFIVPEPGQSVTIESIQKYCMDRIPRYAVPDRVLVLSSLPRTATGKIDRQKLKQHPEF